MDEGESTSVLMKIYSVFFLHFIFLSLFNGHHSSDPKSVFVHSPEDNDQKPDTLQTEESQERAFISRAGRRFFVIIYMRPFTVGSRVVWREVRRETIDLRQFRNVWRKFRIGQSASRRTTEISIINVNNEPNVGNNNSRMPPNRNKENDKNYHGNSKTSNSSRGATESEEEYFEVDNPENVITKSPGTISPDSNFLAGIVNDFAFKLVETQNLESNFVISPLSIFVALSMCYLGADGRTKAQLEEALGMKDNAVHGEDLHQGIKDLLSLVLKDNRGYKLFLANGMFLGKNFTADTQFEENIKKYYDAELENVDFGNPELSERLINDWVVRNTNNTIRRIIDSAPSLLTRLILLNAVYFEGYWKIRFPLHLTYPGNFHAIDGSETRVRFMNVLDETFPIFRSDEHKHTFIKLPYEGDQLSMIIALPYTESGKPMPSITDQILFDVRQAMVNTTLDTVAIPKFRLHYTTSLIESLQDLGITDMFDSNAADFIKLRKEKDIYVSDIMHKAVIRVNEVGTTASASTAVQLNPLSAGTSINFVADHPFSFYIVHEASGLVLFYGKVFDMVAVPRGASNPSPAH